MVMMIDDDADDPDDDDDEGGGGGSASGLEESDKDLNQQASRIRITFVVVVCNSKAYNARNHNLLRRQQYRTE